jgi:hypothetical protein
LERYPENTGILLENSSVDVQLAAVEGIGAG